MKGIIIVMIILCNIIFVEAIEIGKFNYSPYDKANTTNIEDGVLIGNRNVICGFNTIKKDFFTNLPIFSFTKFKSNEYIGTGSTPYIINISKNDTLLKLHEGETVYKMLNVKDKYIIAVILPKSYVLKIQDKNIDTLAVFENKSINEMKIINNKVYIAVNNKLYRLDNNKFNHIYTTEDKNISFIGNINKDVIIGTEGNGTLININKNKVIFSMKKSEIVYATVNNKKTYILLNIDNNEKMQSKLIVIDNNSVDTLFTQKGFFVSGNKNKYGLFLFQGDLPNVIFYDYNEFFNMGSIDSDYILDSYTSNNEIYITTGLPGNIYVIKNKKENSIFYSNIIDLNKKVLINSISLNTKSKGKLFIRIGNTPFIDSTWTNFLLIRANKKINIPEARYVQLKYELNKNNTIIGKISLYYKTKNHRPQIDSVLVYTPRIIPSNIQENILLYAIDNTNYYPEYNNIYKTPQKIIYVEWLAKDIDNDLLLYDLYLEDKYGKYAIKRNSRDNYALIYIDSYDEGYYDLIIIAKDSLSNDEDFLISEYRYKDLFIDNTSPIIENVNYKLGTLSFMAKDNNSFIDEAYYIVNGGEIVNIYPKDRIFDSNEEYFETKINRNNKETLLIMIFVKDIYGNIGRYKKIVK